MPKSALIHRVSPEERHKRHRTHQGKVYQNWQVWSIGADRHYLGAKTAKRKTFEQWLKLYGDKLRSREFDILSIIRLFSATENKTFFEKAKIIHWGIDQGFLTKGYRYTWAYLPMFALLEDLHFINPLGHRKYALTNRAKLLFSYYEQHLKTFFAV